MDLVGDARFALLGEASHGTHDFYRERAQIAKRLIEEKGFVAVAVGADWPDAYRLDRYVRRLSDDVDAIEAHYEGIRGYEEYRATSFSCTLQA